MPRPWMIGIPVVALLLGLWAGVVLGPRSAERQREQDRTRAEAARLDALRGCLTLESWTLDRRPNGGAEVKAVVRAGRDGRIAIDAHADLGNDEVLVPVTQLERLMPTPVKAGERVVLERPLRRVRPGEPDAFSLRFSCRPPGPQGVFGVVEYATGVAREGPDETGNNLVRPLPAPGT